MSLVIGETAQAEALVEKALKEKPDDPATLQLAAIFYLAQGRTAEGMKCLEALSAPAPGANVRGPGVGQSNQGQGPPEDAAERKTWKRPSSLVQRNLKDNPSSVPDLQVYAKILASSPEPERPPRWRSRISRSWTNPGISKPMISSCWHSYYLNEKKDDTKYQDEMLKVLVEQ